jgi:hypothetical protein
LRNEIEHVRQLPGSGVVRDLERAGIRTASAEELLVRRQRKIDGLCVAPDRQLGEERRKDPGTNKVINGPIERRFRRTAIESAGAAQKELYLLKTLEQWVVSPNFPRRGRVLLWELS